MSRANPGGRPTREDLLLEVGLLASAGRRGDRAGIASHHADVVAIVDVLLPPPSRSVCPECEVGGGLHVEGCPRASEVESGR